VPANKIARPVLLGATGTATLTGGELTLTKVSGPAGQSLDLVVLLPEGKTVTKATVNGKPATFKAGNGCGTIPVTFAGMRIDHCQQVGAYDPGFSGKAYQADLTVTQQVFEQLAARRKAWPVDYTEEELLATWRGSDRLLLFIQIADPNDEWSVGLKIDGQPVEVKKAYGDVFPLGRERTFSGFYADLSKLPPNVPHKLEVALPDGLQPGQFQGLFLENVEAGFTRELAH
jgi:hypothetical protein